MEKLTYSRCGDYYIPSLKLAEQLDKPIGKYGRIRFEKLYSYGSRPYALSDAFYLFMCFIL